MPVAGTVRTASLIAVMVCVAVLAVFGTASTAAAAGQPCKIQDRYFVQYVDSTIDSNISLEMAPYDCGSATTGWGTVGPFSKPYPDGIRGEARFWLDYRNYCIDAACSARVHLIERTLCLTRFTVSYATDGTLGFKCGLAVHHRILTEWPGHNPIDRWDVLRRFQCSNYLILGMTCLDKTYRKEGLTVMGIGSLHPQIQYVR